jgi:1-deoxy-D-xylulose-5-phosphate reductoisomerase
LDVIQALGDRLSVLGLSAHRQWQQLCQQAETFHPRWVTLTDDDCAPELGPFIAGGTTRVLRGSEGVEAMASSPDTDVVLTAIVGAAGLRGTWAALESGKTVAVANKETLVLAGPLVMDLARRRGARLIPVDSEHSALFQALQAGRRSEVRRVVLTASGGPFRRLPASELERVTVAQALAHPTWQMGPKITIDSATMMNKALEVIEARWLFDLKPEQIEVVVHPESIVHSMVEFTDGSVVAQASPPDMRLPIQYALTYPDRVSGPARRMDFTQTYQWNFEPPDFEKFPALELGYEAARRGGTAGAVLNAANEAAVERFMNEQIGFADIPRACRAVLENHDFEASPTLEGLLASDRWARKEVRRWTRS